MRARELLDHSRRPETVRYSVKVAVVVGTVLNLINHYDVLLGASLHLQTLVQMGLTYLVPYVVSTHGQLAGLSRQQGG